MDHFRRKPNQKGFTMIELMVVVVIVGVLAAIAIPVYGKYVKNSRVTEGTGRMGEIVTACKAWAQENPIAGVPQWPTNAQFQAGNGILDPGATTNFTYALTPGGGAATAPLTITGTGINHMAGVTITMVVANISATGVVTVTGL